jgi:hypothetical protein
MLKVIKPAIQYLKSRILRPCTSNTPRAPLTNAKAKLSAVSSELSAAVTSADKNNFYHNIELQLIWQNVSREEYIRQIDSV